MTTRPRRLAGPVVIAAAAAVTLVLALLALMYVVTNVADGGGAAPQDQQSEGAPAPEEKPDDGAAGDPPTAGDGVMAATSADGAARLEVRDVACGQTRIPSRQVAVQENGHYCVLDVTLTNLGEDTVTLAHDAQSMVTGDLREVAADRPSRVEEQDPLWEPLPAGGSASGLLVFTLFTGETPDRLLFRYSPFAEPAEIALLEGGD